MSNSDEKGRAGAQPSANWDLMFHPLPDCKKLGIDESYANPEAPQDLGRETTGIFARGRGWLVFSAFLGTAAATGDQSTHALCAMYVAV